jgi:hypothetical protein
VRDCLCGDVRSKATGAGFTLGETDFAPDGSRIVAGGAPSEPTDNEPSVGDVGTVASLTTDVVDAPLSVLDQGIVLALCLDIKNHNPLVFVPLCSLRPACGP